MTVSSTTNRKTFTGDGATTSFGTSPVVFFNTSDLQVYVVTTATGAATLLTENTHYTVSGGSGSTGTVSTAGGSSPYGAPSAAQTLVIVRDLPITQAVDFVNNEASDAEVAEDALDKLVMIAQQLDARIDRSFTLADSDVSGASTQIPTPSANGLIKWNSGATALENGSAVDLDLAVVSPFMLTLLDDSTAADARTTLGAVGLTGNETIAGNKTLSGNTVMTGTATMTGKSIIEAEGAAVASASSCNIWATDGNTVHITGTTTINDFATAPQAGAWMKVIFDGALTLTQSANLNLNGGGANITTAANDMAFVYADTTTQMDVFVVRKSGAAVVATGITLGTEQASTSGTSIDFTGIPSGVKRITVMFDEVSTNGTSPIIIQLGDAGGFENTGYNGAVQRDANSTAYTSGFLMEFNVSAASNTRSGMLILSLEDSANFTWCGFGNFANVNPYTNLTAGRKALSAELTQVRITCVNGTDTFDAGAINIQYES